MADEKIKKALKKNLPKFKEVNFSNIMWVLGDMADRKEITEEQYEASRKRYLAKIMNCEKCSRCNFEGDQDNPLSEMEHKGSNLWICQDCRFKMEDEK